MPYAAFLFWNLIGTLPKATAIVLVGWLFWQTVLQGDTETAITLLLTLAAVAAATLLYKRRRRSG
jgi:LPXTG-motif cell wall-anchored protein